MKMQKIAGPHGTDYRIGDYVAIKDDTEVVDPTDHDGNEIISHVTWGAVPADVYDQHNGDVGLPDAVFEASRLRDLRARIEQEASEVSPPATS